MNDEYIQGFRKTPDPTLIARIHARLERRERTQRIKRYSFLSMLVLTFIFGMLVTFSSKVRADVITIIMRIGGVEYQITSENPFNTHIPAVELEPEYLPWEGAKARFRSPLQLPTYVPEGYEREADTHLYIWGDGTPTLEVFWRKEGEYPMIGLFIAQCRSEEQGCGWLVGEGGLEEITLNGKPATLIRGSWDEETQQYELPVMVSIIWRYDEDSVYKLWSFDQSLVDELIKMAESIP